MSANANYKDNEVLSVIDDCVKKEFTDVNLARNVAVFLALTLLDRPLCGIDSYYSMSRKEIDSARRAITKANSEDRLMASRVAGCRLATWRMIRAKAGS